MSAKLQPFIDQCAESGLLSADEVAQFLKAQPADKPLEEAEDLARELVRAGKLTKYQASALYQGKGRNLVLGDYVIFDKIGSGGMGQVFKARHVRMKRVVALKLLPAALTKDAGAIARFEREVQAAAKLTHPNIVAAHDAGAARGMHYLVMEFVEGQDLSRIVQERGPLPVEEAVGYILQAARGLAFAHSEGVVHRDIKPANLLVDKKGTVKVLDMGLARLDDGAADDQLTKSGQMMGTIDYMAPEQAEDTHAADARSDIYSLGCTLFRLLTGENVFQADTTVRKILAHMNDPVPLLSIKRRDVPAALDGVFQKMLAKRPADRYQQTDDLIRDLEAIQIVVASGVDPGQGLPPDASGLTNFTQVLREPAVVPAPPVQKPLKKATPILVAERLEAEVDTDPKSQLTLQSMSAFLGPVAVRSPPLRPLRWSTQVWVVIGGLVAVSAALLIGLVMVLPHLGSPGKKTELGKDDGQSSPKIPQPGKAAPTESEKSFGAGWRGWPADAPPSANAPFDAAQGKAHQEAWAKYLGVPVEYTNSLGMKFRLIPPGEFLMGSTPEEIDETLKHFTNDEHGQDCVKSEGPQHKVILTQPIYLGIHEVTQRDYEAVRGNNPSHFAPLGMGKAAVAGANTISHPVEMVSWNDAAEFCARLSAREGLNPFQLPGGKTGTTLQGNGYRLPTEAQWEFACRAGTTARFCCGDKDEDLAQVGWFGINYGRRTHTVGERQGNQFGLYDMLGNVGEWVQDSWDRTYYRKFQDQPAIDPSGPPSTGSGPLIRGGSCHALSSYCRASFRWGIPPTTHSNSFGFRVSLSVDGVRQAIKDQANKLAKLNTDLPRDASPQPVAPFNAAQPKDQAAKPAITSAGWKGFPKDAPPHASAPFSAVQARKHQNEWAKYLGVPAEYTNSIGMKFRLIPPGEFVMGTAAGDIEELVKQLGATDKNQADRIRLEGPQHRVLLTSPFYLGAHEVTQQQYESVTGKKPSSFSPEGRLKDNLEGQDNNGFPVEQVSWLEAVDFCSKLSESEGHGPFYGRNPSVVVRGGDGYRLPTEAQWEYACRAGTTTRFWTGDTDQSVARAAWCWPASKQKRPATVGSLAANPFGLFDVHGNVWEWCHDGWDPEGYRVFKEELSINPETSWEKSPLRVVRGGHWFWVPSNCRSARRMELSQEFRSQDFGFRAVLSVAAVKKSIERDKAAGKAPSGESLTWQGWPADAPEPATAPFDAAEAKEHQEGWADYLKVKPELISRSGLKFRLIPPGKFRMGAEATINAAEPQHRPQHDVEITAPFWMSACEVTQAEFRQVMGRNPSAFSAAGKHAAKVGNLDTSNYPVEQVTWFDALDFCNRLSVRDKLKPAYRLTNINKSSADGPIVKANVVLQEAADGYRLPTEAQWEYACRAGTQTSYNYGDDARQYARFSRCQDARGAGPVQQFPANAWGLFDMHGSACEWCLDGYDPKFYESSPKVDPSAPLNAPKHVIRGGSWGWLVTGTASGTRGSIPGGHMGDGEGMRIIKPIPRPAENSSGAPAGNAAATPPATRDADRAAAEWVLKTGGTLQVLVGAKASPAGVQKIATSLPRCNIISIASQEPLPAASPSPSRSATQPSQSP